MFVLKSQMLDPSIGWMHVSLLGHGAPGQRGECEYEQSLHVF